MRRIGPVWRREDRVESPALPSSPGERARSARAPFRVGLLFGAVVAVSIVGVVVGRALVRNVAAPPATATTTTPATSASRSRPPRTRPRTPGIVRLGPLAVRAVAHFAAGAVGGEVSAAGGRLVVIAGVGARSVFIGPPRGLLPRVATLVAGLTAAPLLPVGAAAYAIGGIRAGKVSAEILHVDAARGRVLNGGSFQEPIADAAVAAGSAGSYLVGGFTGTRYATAVLRIGSAASSSLVTRLPHGLRGASAVLVGARIYLAGGRTQAGLSRAVMEIDVGTGTVRSLGLLPQALEGGVLVASGSLLYLLGGTPASGRALATVLAIDPVTGRVREAGHMPAPLGPASAVALGGRTFVVVFDAGVVYRLG